MGIPKIIHQTLRSKQDIDPAFRENIANLKRLNPSWEHRLYDDEDIPLFILRHFGPDILNCFNLIDPRYGAARADFFRYLLMYVEGGVYLDIKSTATQALDEVLRDDDEYLLSHWRNKPGEEFEGLGFMPGIGPDGEFQQWHIICAARHPFLEAVIKKVKSNIEAGGVSQGSSGFTGVVFLTGPIAYTQAIEPIVGNYAHRKVDIQDLGFKYTFLSRNGHREKLQGHHYSTLGLPILRFDSAMVTDKLISTLSRRFEGGTGGILNAAFLARLRGGSARITTFHGTRLFYFYEMDRCIHDDDARSCLHVPVQFELCGTSLTFFVEVGGIRIYLGVSKTGQLTSQFNATEQGAPPLFQIGGQAEGHFTISWKEHFLAAEAGGKLVFDRLVADQWETFSAIPDPPPTERRDSAQSQPGADQPVYQLAV